MNRPDRDLRRPYFNSRFMYSDRELRGNVAWRLLTSSRSWGSRTRISAPPKALDVLMLPKLNIDTSACAAHVPVSGKRLSVVLDQEHAVAPSVVGDFFEAEPATV